MSNIPMNVRSTESTVKVQTKNVINTGGGGGTTNYNLLTNKPMINGQVLQGDKSLDDLGITEAIGAEVESYVEGHKEELRGLPGEPGAPGAPGKDGYTPTAKVERTENGAKITITDKNGTTEAIVNDGHGESGTDDYNELVNKPKINGIELVGNVVTGNRTFNASVVGSKLVFSITENGNEVLY